MDKQKTTLNELAAAIHENAVVHGWWDEPRTFPEVIALIHSELSESLEEYRDGKPPVYYTQNSTSVVPIGFAKKPEGMAVELADAIIRILDYCGREQIDIDAIVREKHEYNKIRPYRHGGKKC